ncbi:MAG TPA: hypothetical protein VFF49_06925 [Thermodesulfobacteriota bacterium]|jgi:NTP pyrophosphatase (non-canonical NTP hydrolase)|nr:hypothetical protein [Thermodesulfobacteriota bacterium]
MDILNFIINLFVKGPLESIFYLVSVIAIIFSILTYRRNSQLERAKWLNSLHEKFYEKDQYKNIRQIIEYETPKLDEIRKSIEKSKKGGEEESIELRDELDDYLNFFEFIASLWKMEQLTLDQVKMVFEHYIRRIAKHKFLLDYITDEGFENLNTLLSQFNSKE